MTLRPGGPAVQINTAPEVNHLTSNTPLVSIIVLTYKKFGFFKYCFDSILCQDYPNIELVISDDSSPNLNKKMLLSYIDCNNKGNIKNIIFNVNEKNLRVVKNKNKAISLSSGKYIVPVYLDDALYDENSVSSIVGFFEEKNCLIFTAFREVMCENMISSKGMYPKPEDAKLLEDGDSLKIFKRLCRSNFIAGASTPFSKSFIEKYGYFDEDYMFLEDYPKFLSAIRQGCEFPLLAKPIFKYRVGGTTTSPEASRLVQRDFMIAYSKEIIPYPELSGNFRHRFISYEYRRWAHEQQGETIKKSLVLAKYPDIAAYRLLRRAGIIKKPIIDF